MCWHVSWAVFAIAPLAWAATGSRTHITRKELRDGTGDPILFKEGDSASFVPSLVEGERLQSYRSFAPPLKSLSTLLLAFSKTIAAADVSKVSTGFHVAGHVYARPQASLLSGGGRLSLQESPQHRGLSMQTEDEGEAEAIQLEPKLDQNSKNSTLTKLDQLKSEFRLLAARANRGFTVEPATRTTLLSMAGEMEAFLDSSMDAASWAPLDSPLVFGRWYLDFTDASDILSLSLLPVPAELGKIYQEVRPGKQADCFVIDNGVELLPPGAGVVGALTGTTLKGVWSVEGACKAISPSKASIIFTGGKFQPLVSDSFELPAISASLPDVLVERLQEALGALGEPINLETTYLDEDMRIGRGPRGELYVLSKREV